MLSKAGEIRRDEGCMDYAGQFLMIYPCHGSKGNQEWVYGPVSGQNPLVDLHEDSGQNHILGRFTENVSR